MKFLKKNLTVKNMHSSIVDMLQFATDVVAVQNYSKTDANLSLSESCRRYKNDKILLDAL